MPGGACHPDRARPALWLLAGLAQLCLLWPGSEAAAAYRGRQWSIQRPQLAAEFSYRYESEARTGPFLSTSNTSSVLDEKLDLKTAGWLYHPAMATYTLELLPEWQQSQDTPEGGRENSNSAFFLGYGFDLNLLPYKPYTFKVFAKRQQSSLTSSLATWSESESDTYGATLWLKYKLLPSTLSYSHADTTQSGFYEAQESRDDVRFDSRDQRPNSLTTLNAVYTNFDRSTLHTLSHAETLTGNLQNTYTLLSKGRRTLSSNLSYRWTDNSLGTTSGLNWSEALNWRHSRRLSSNYSLNYSQDSNQGRRLSQTSANAGLSHSLYENLTSLVGVTVNHGSQGDGSYGGNVNFNYQRRIPGGMIFASLGQDYRVSQRATGGAIVPIVGETHALSTGDVTFLGNRNVDLASIAVSAADGTPYLRDFDYTLEVIGASVRLRRTTFGAIAEGQSVRVNYTYQSNPAYDDAVHAQSYGLGFFLWSAWRLDYRYSHSQQDFLAGVRPDVLNEDTTQTVDSDLTWRWSTTRFHYEDSDRNAGTSVKRWQLDEGLRFNPSYLTSLGLSAYVGHTTLKESNAQERFHGFRADVQRLISGTSKVRFEGLYNVSDGTTLRTQDKGAAAIWEWSYGIWRAEATYRYLLQDDLLSGQSRERHSLYAVLRRELF